MLDFNGIYSIPIIILQTLLYESVDLWIEYYAPRKSTTMVAIAKNFKTRLNIMNMTKKTTNCVHQNIKGDLPTRSFFAF